MIDTDPSNRNPHQDPRFLALKNAFRIRSGVTRGQPKGTTNTPYVTDTPWGPGTQAQPATLAPNGTSGVSRRTGSAADASTIRGAPAQPLTTLTYSWGYCNNCAELDPNNILSVWEPGPGTYNHAPNFGLGTHSYDDHTTYYNDRNFYDLCGPGAADAALWYWSAPPNFNPYTARDPWNGTTTYWAGQDVDGVYRLRGYMVNLAWNIHAPTWPSGVNGMMQGGTATTDSKMTDALNWEASGENPSTWQNYYYTLASGSSTAFHYDVVFDIGTNNVPVVVLLNAQAGLPNWPYSPGSRVGHWITILGYNDTTGEYAYTDTCGSTTGCNTYDGSGNNRPPSDLQYVNYDGGVKRAKQSQVWSAIASYGDWVW